MKLFLLMPLFLLPFTGIPPAIITPGSSVAHTKPALPAADSARDTVRIEPRETWLAATAKPFKKHVPKQITVHHEGGKTLGATEDAKIRLKNIQTWCMGPDRGWADIPYHVLIAPDGTVYQGRDPWTVGESATEYDPTGHLLICFLGNYQEQKLDEHLIQTLVDLLVDSCIKYGIDPSAISTHRDHSDQTTCPGEQIYAYFKNGEIVSRVKQALQQRL